jgi:hypothetical protein
MAENFSMTTTETETPVIDRILEEGRTRRLAQRIQMRRDIAKAEADLRDSLAKIERMGQKMIDIDRRLTALEKQIDILALQPPRQALTSWSPAGLAAALANMPADELAKLRQ